MIRFFCFVLVFCGLTALSAASQPPLPTHHDLKVKLDPSSGAITVSDAITLDGNDRLFLQFADWMTLEEVVQDGKTSAWRAHADGVVVPLEGEGRQTVTVKLTGAVPGLDPGGRGRDLPSAFAGDIGAFLSGYSGWFPYIGDEVISYRLEISVPEPFHAVSSGSLSGETTTDDGNTAVFERDLSLEPPSLFVGPYKIDTRDVAGIHLRTYFPEQLTGYAEQYLETAGGYLARFSEEIGAYPYQDFHIIASPLPVGLGYPNLTYIGEMIVPLPFMQGQSLAHEILHNWWGNGVHVDYSSGNWAEGLTTYMADYGLARKKGEEAAREMRLGWLRDYAALPAKRDQAVNRFISKRHQAAQVIGYNKTAHIFHMLEDEIGEEAFSKGIRHFWSAHKFAIAGWSDLQSAFEQASDQDLAWFFEQWITEPGAPAISVSDVAISREDDAHITTLTVNQSAPAYRLRVPVTLETETGTTQQQIRVENTSTTIRLSTSDKPTKIRIDPDFDLFRHLLPGESPPILRDVLLAGAVDIVVLDDGIDANAVMNTAPRLVDRITKTTLAEEFRTGNGPAIIFGTSDSLELFAEKHGLERNSVPDKGGTASAWADETADGDTLLLISIDGSGALQTIGRALRHYGRQSFVVFADGRAAERGIWPSGDSPLSIALPGQPGQD